MILKNVDGGISKIKLTFLQRLILLFTFKEFTLTFKDATFVVNFEEHKLKTKKRR